MNTTNTNAQEYVAVGNHGTDTEEELKSFRTFKEATAFASNPRNAADWDSIDVMKRVAGVLTAEF